MSDNMHEKPSRRPVMFDVADEPLETQKTSAPRKPGYFDQGAVHISDEEDIFLGGAEMDGETLEQRVLAPSKRRFPLFKLAIGAFGFVLSMAIGLWTDRLVTDLFSRADWLGYTAIVAVVVTVLAALGFIARELLGLASLANVQKLKAQARAAYLSRDRAAAQSTVKALAAHLSHRPETARGRTALAEHRNDIIDNEDLIALAETELLTPLDREARMLIANSARRVSVVTAVSPRALADIGYVIFEASRLVSALATLYGGRPGFFGLLRLLRETIAHLAVTGAIAVGDDAIQQVLGHGLASKVSAKLGEGVANGLMTARVGIAAMDLCRPMDFREARRPKVTDFLNVLSNRTKSSP
jgi:putative membrane protein